MDQTIGIEFKPLGMEATEKAFTRIEQGLWKISSMADLVERAMGKITQGIAQITGESNQFRSQIADMTRSSQTFGKETAHAFTTAAKAAKEMNKAVATGGTGGRGYSPPYGGGFFGPGLGSLSAPGFMLRYKAYSEILRGGHALMTDVLLGKAREPLMEEYAGLGFLGMDRERAEAVEERGRAFRRKAPWAGVKIPEYMRMAREDISGMSEYFPDANLAADQIGRITDLSAMMAKATKTSPEIMARLLGKALSASTMFMPDEERKAYQTGEKSIADLGTILAGKIATVVQKTHEWGGDVQHMMTYALPAAFSRGMTMESLLSLGGALISAGPPGQKTFRGLKTIMETSGPAIERLRAAAYGDKGAPDLARIEGMKGDARKYYLQAVGEQHMKEFAADPLGMVKQMSAWVKKAEAKGLPLSSMGFKTEWLTQLRTMFTGGWQEKAEAALKDMPQTLESAEEKFVWMMDYMNKAAGPETTWARVHNAWDDLWSKWAQIAQKSEDVQGLTASILSSFTTTRKYLEGTATDVQAWDASLTAVVKGGLFTMDKLVGSFWGLTQAFSNKLQEWGIVPKDVDVKQGLFEALGLRGKMPTESYVELLPEAGRFFGRDFQDLQFPTRIEPVPLGQLFSPPDTIGKALGEIIAEGFDAGCSQPSAPGGAAGLNPAEIGAVIAEALQNTPSGVAEVHVHLDGQEIGRSTAEFFREQALSMGASWGSHY